MEPVTSRLARGAVGDIMDTHRDHRERSLYPYSVEVHPMTWRTLVETARVTAYILAMCAVFFTVIVMAS